MIERMTETNINRCECCDDLFCGNCVGGIKCMIDKIYSHYCSQECHDNHCECLEVE